MGEFFIPSSLGNRIAPAAASSLVLSGSSGFNYTSTTMRDVHRIGMIVTAYGNPVYVKLFEFGSTGTVSSTDYDYCVAANSSLFIAAKRMLDATVTTAGTFSAVEVL